MPMSYFSKETIQNVWNKAQTVPGKNPNLYRQDAYGNPIYVHSYGKTSEMGWEIDHKHPRSKGGTDNPRNLQALQTAENRRKGNTYPY